MNGPRPRRPRREDDNATHNGTGMRPMHISLRSGERLFLNGAVLRVDRKVTLELLNDATFLLENHVLQVEDTTTPLRQLYFAAQAMLMDPQNARSSRALFNAMAADLRNALTSERLIKGLDEACSLIAAERPFQALKALRALFDEEATVLASQARPARPEERDPGRAGDSDAIGPVVPPQNYGQGPSGARGGQSGASTILQQH